MIENLLSVAPTGTRSSFYRTSAGAEIKSGLTAKPTKGYHNAIKDIEATHCFIVYAGQEQYPIAENIQAISLTGIMKLIESY